MGNAYRIINLFIIGLTVILGIVCLLTLPGEIAVHWNDLGVADGFMAKELAVAVSFLTAALCLYVWYDVRNKYVAWFAWKRSLCIVTDCILGGLSCLGVILNVVFLLKN